MGGNHSSNLLSRQHLHVKLRIINQIIQISRFTIKANLTSRQLTRTMNVSINHATPYMAYIRQDIPQNSMMFITTTHIRNIRRPFIERTMTITRQRHMIQTIQKIRSVLNIFRQMFNRRLLYDRTSKQRNSDRNIRTTIIRRLSHRYQDMPFIRIKRIKIISVRVILIQQGIMPLRVNFHNIPQIQITSNIILNIISSSRQLTNFSRRVLSITKGTMRHVTHAALLTRILTFSRLTIRTQVRSTQGSRRRTINVRIFIKIIASLSMLITRPLIELSHFKGHHTYRMSLLSRRFTNLRHSITLFSNCNHRGNTLTTPHRIRSNQAFHPHFILVSKRRRHFTQEFNFVSLGPQHDVNKGVRIRVFLKRICRRVTTRHTRSFKCSSKVSHFFKVINTKYRTHYRRNHNRGWRGLFRG